MISEIRVTLVRNLGNYEKKEVSLVASLSQGDDFNHWKNFVDEEVFKMAANTPIIRNEVTPPPIPTKPEVVVEKEAPVEIKEEKAKSKTKSKTKATVEVPTLQEMMELCRATAQALKSSDKVKALIQTACGVGSLGEVTDTSTFIELKKLLEKAK